jgi:tetratricopeptide (TPR) repeat protein
VGLLLLLLIGGGFYLYLQSLQKPELVMVRSAAKPATLPSVANPPAASPAPGEANAPIQEVKPVEPVPHAAEVFEKPATDDAVKTKKELIAPAEQPQQAEPRTKTGRSKQLAFGDPLPVSEDAKVKVTRNNPGPGVNPVLLSAYQAFNAGDDVTAQELYRQVLQGDVRNVDALLGMAAIAARQNRSEDALGWYGKVLEVEPRNTVAQVAFVNVLAQTDPVGSESRIKNLLVQQPEAAYLHAALGSIYADQSQWSQAQQAYFQAYHFDPNNAEYAFNLAVSLDQLGKSSLALQYYKNALELLSKSGTTHIDRAKLESRIGQLQ